jgi:hypothetical protein
MSIVAPVVQLTTPTVLVPSSLTPYAIQSAGAGSDMALAPAGTSAVARLTRATRMTVDRARIRATISTTRQPLNAFTASPQP